MDSNEYLKNAGACLSKAENWLESFDPDELDYTPADGVVTMEFADGVKFVLNRQGAASQMWFAAGARAWHFNYDASKGQWIDDKEGHELFARITEAVSAKLGRTVKL